MSSERLHHVLTNMAQEKNSPEDFFMAAYYVRGLYETAFRKVFGKKIGYFLSDQLLSIGLEDHWPSRIPLKERRDKAHLQQSFFQ